MAEYHQMLFEHPFFIRSFISAYHMEKWTPSEACAEEVYPFSQLFYLTEGEALYSTGGKEYPLKAGDMIYRPARIPFTFTWVKTPVSLSLVSFLLDSPSMAIFAPAPFSLYGEEISTFLDLVATGVRITEPVRKQNFVGQKLIEDTPPEAIGFVGASLERFLSMVYCRLKKIPLLPDRSRKVREYREEEALASRIRQYLLDHLRETVSLPALAAAFGVSERTVSRAFRRCYNRSAIDWLSDSRIEVAKQLIEGSKMNFTEIAEHLGFSSVNYFSKMFKKKTGMTPTEYSKAAPLMTVMPDR